jgi:hypothetical protein
VLTRDGAAAAVAVVAAAIPKTGPNHQKTKMLNMPITNAATAIYPLLIVEAASAVPQSVFQICPKGNTSMDNFNALDGGLLASLIKRSQ